MLLANNVESVCTGLAWIVSFPRCTVGSNIIGVVQSFALLEKSVQMLTRLALKKKQKQTKKQINKQKIKLELGLRATCFFKRVIRF